MLRAVCMLMFMIATASGASASPDITAIRIGQHPDKLRFVMELSEEPTYRIFTLPDPYRVVIDLPEFDWRVAQDATPAGGGLIEAMRYGLFAPGAGRVVLDLQAPVGIQQVFVLPPTADFAFRLVIDLVPISREAFLSDRHRRPVRSAKALPIAPPVPQRAPAPDDPRPTVVIDPGHGGVDPGAIGTSGIYEKELTLYYARELKRQLEATGRYRVVMTRNEDIFLRLRDRIAIAQQVDGDLFLSLHANAHNSRETLGASVYTLSEQSSDAEAAALAAKENRADIIAGVNLSDQTEVVSKILIDLAQRETMNHSKHLANTMVYELGQTTRVLRNPHRFAGFAVLKSPNVPSVLVEIGYMSNREEEQLLRSTAHRERLAAAIVRAVDSYFEWQQSLNRS
jgi:N-acetylmuramoyl-L-alanine amidase